MWLWLLNKSLFRDHPSYIAIIWHGAMCGATIKQATLLWWDNWLYTIGQSYIKHGAMGYYQASIWWDNWLQRIGQRQTIISPKNSLCYMPHGTCIFKTPICLWAWEIMLSLAMLLLTTSSYNLHAYSLPLWAWEIMLATSQQVSTILTHKIITHLYTAYYNRLLLIIFPITTRDYNTQNYTTSVLATSTSTMFA